MADTSYQPLTGRLQGGDTTYVRSGGTLDLQTGAIITDSTAGVSVDRVEFVDTVAWTGTVSTAGGHGSWTAPTGSDVIITGFSLDVTVACATANGKLDVGTATTTITTAGTDLMDSLVATGTAGVKLSTGTGMPTAIKLAAGKFITAGATGSKLTALVSKAYIRYVVV